MQSLRLASPKSVGLAGRLNTQGRGNAAVGVQRQSAAKIPSSSVAPSFSFRPLTYWVRLTDIMESHLLYSKSTDLNVNLT